MLNKNTFRPDGEQIEGSRNHVGTAKDEKFGLLADVTLVEKAVVQRFEHHKWRRQISQNL